MALDPICICLFSICLITCWRCFLPFRLALPIMPYPLYIVTLKTKVKNDIEDSTEGRNDFKIPKSLDSKKALCNVQGSITEITPILKTKICYSDYEEFSKGYCSYYGSLNIGNVFSNTEVEDLTKIKTHTKDTIQIFDKANMERHNAKSAQYYLSEEIRNVSTNTRSSSTETLINSKGKKSAFWMKNKSGMYDLVTRSRNFLKKYANKLRQRKTRN